MKPINTVNNVTKMACKNNYKHLLQTISYFKDTDRFWSDNYINI